MKFIYKLTVCILFLIFSFFFLNMSFLQQAFASVDVCNTGGGLTNPGVCFYSSIQAKDHYVTDTFDSCQGLNCPDVPSCSNITYGNTTYTDAGTLDGCNPGFGAPVRCCIPANKSVVTQGITSCEGFEPGQNTAEKGVCFYKSDDYRVYAATSTTAGYSYLKNTPGNTTDILDTCYGSKDSSGTKYQTTDPQAQQCFNNPLPDCKTMTQTAFGDSKYHVITDQLQGCGGQVYIVGTNDQAQQQAKIENTGTSMCCASDSQVPLAPPAPCNLDKNGNCATVTTGVGDISTSVSGFVQSLFTLILSISGAIAILILLFNGYRIMMSQGDAEKLKNAREAITAALIGLVFMVFSVIILKIIGVDILHIPDFFGHK